MIKEKGIDPSEILAVTFTNKAAKEMRARIGKSLGIEIGNNPYRTRGLPFIGTFHGMWVFFLKEVINMFADSDELRLGIKKDFIIYDASDTLSILKSIAKEMNMDEKEYPSRKIQSYISNAKNKLYTPKMYEQSVDNHFKEVVADVYYKYEKKLNENNALDFDDILVKTLDALKNPTVQRYYNDKYKYIMIDEYQDTNKPQYEIVKFLAAKHQNLAVVWDDWQSIYSWRWADMTNIINFKKDYPEAKVVKLEQNYRSTKSIIDAANSVIKNNVNSLKKELWTDNKVGEKIRYIEAVDDRQEAKIITEIIKEKFEEEKSPYKDNLILYRTNGQSRNFEEALMLQWVPYRVVWSLKFYDRKEVKDLLGYLKVLYNQDDIVGFKRIINTPSRKIGAKSVSVLDGLRNDFWLNYLQIIENIDEVDDLRSNAKESLKWFMEIYASLYESSKTLVVSELIWEIVKKINYEAYLKDGFTKEEVEAKLENIEEFKNVASNYNGMDPRESLWIFLEEVALITDMDRDQKLDDMVTLMTIHNSKGLEEKRVFIAGAEEGIFPHMRTINSEKELEEERRLMYVAMTRAENELYIARARERFYFWDYVRNPESRFIKEIPAQFIENYVYKSALTNPNTGKSFFDSFASLPVSEGSAGTRVIKPKVNNDVTSFSMWDKIEHHKFGNGIITSLNWELAEIAFPGIWIKKMNIKIAPVKKV